MKNLIRTIKSGLVKFFFNSAVNETKGLYINAVEIAGLKEDEFIKIVPVGYFPNHPDGAHEITFKQIQEMASNLANAGTDILFDFGHDSLWNMGAKAAGWSDKNSVQAKEDGLYIKYPEFTANAKAALEQREYRYFSPVYAINAKDKDGKEIGAKLHSVGLTNTPYMDKEIDHAKNAHSFINKEDNTMNKKLLAFIGLAENASETEIEAKLNSYRTVLGLEADAGLEKVANTIKINSAAAKTETKETQSDLSGIENRLKALENKTESERIEMLINSAVNDGKILPADKEIYINSARADFNKTKAALDQKTKNSALPNTVKVPDENVNQVKKNSVQDAAVFLRNAAGK